MQSYTFRKLIHIIIILAVGIAIYTNSLNVPFIFDDTSNIQNPAIQVENLSIDNVSKIFSQSLLKTRPVSNASFALNYYIGGERVQGYHIINIIIHLTATVVLYFLILNTLILSDNEKFIKYRFSISFWTAFIWMSHPLATQSVTYIVQRMNSMASMFYILSLLLFILARKEINSAQLKDRSHTKHGIFLFLLSFVAGILAIGSKEIAATLPIAILGYEWFFFQKLSGNWLKKKVTVILLVLFIFVVLAFIYTKGNLYDAIFSVYNHRSFTLEERLLTQPRVIIHYLELFFLPLPDKLSLDYSFPLSRSLFQPITTFFAALFLLLLAGAGVAIAKTERLFSFCIFWFFLNLLIESSVIPLEIIYEHRTYLPSMFLILLLILLLFRFIPSSKTCTVLLFSLSLALCYWTIQRNEIWSDPVQLWSKSLAQFPDNARIHTNIAVEYSKRDEQQKAEEHFRIALKLKPHNALVYSNLAKIYETKGNYRYAEQLARKAIEISPNHVIARLHLASLLKKIGRFDEALNHYEYVHKAFPTFSVPNMEIGLLLLDKNKPEIALEYLRAAMPRQADNLPLILGLAETNMRLGRVEESIKYYEKVLEQNPNHITSLYNLAILYSEAGRPELTELYYRKAYLIQPSFVPVAFNYGNFLLRLGNFSQAGAAYKQFLSQENIMADAHNNLGLSYLNSNMPSNALSEFEKALRINPQHELAARNVKLLRDSLEQDSQFE